MKGYPKVNYIGNKERIADAIMSAVPAYAGTLFDAFAGGCSVSYAAKARGMRVYSNDILDINYQLAKALIENSGEVLTDRDVEDIFAGEPFCGFMTGNYADVYYFPRECMELDLYRRNIGRIDNGYKRAMAYALMRRAMIRKMPYSRFTIKWDKVRQLRDEQYSYEKYGRYRSYHNKSFRFHFEDNLGDYNSAVFSNGQDNVALNMDVYDAIDAVDADVVYADPPYAGTMNNYYGFYGLLDTYIRQEKTMPFANSFMDKDTIMEQFDRLFAAFGKYRCLILSYNSRSIPTREQIAGLLSRYRRNIRIQEIRHAYKVTGKEKKGKDIEYLFIADND